ncbi:hypothetical protein, partial [uncultured Desulfovibrio sp.]|uniref:hypothetical protein n=1 Tax=uncultured Desulfovibrio sp. TaxID=167968 RepID=UPI0026704A30
DKIHKRHAFGLTAAKNTLYEQLTGFTRHPHRSNFFFQVNLSKYINVLYVIFCDLPGTFLFLEKEIATGK